MQFTDLLLELIAIELLMDRWNLLSRLLERLNHIIKASNMVMMSMSQKYLCHNWLDGTLTEVSFQILEEQGIPRTWFTSVYHDSISLVLVAYHVDICSTETSLTWVLSSYHCYRVSHLLPGKLGHSLLHLSNESPLQLSQISVELTTKGQD